MLQWQQLQSPKPSSAVLLPRPSTDLGQNIGATCWRLLAGNTSACASPDIWRCPCCCCRACCPFSEFTCAGTDPDCGCAGNKAGSCAKMSEADVGGICCGCDPINYTMAAKASAEESLCCWCCCCAGSQAVLRRQRLHVLQTVCHGQLFPLFPSFTLLWQQLLYVSVPLQLLMPLHPPSALLPSWPNSQPASLQLLLELQQIYFQVISSSPVVVGPSPSSALSPVCAGS